MSYRKYETIVLYLPDVAEDAKKRVNERLFEMMNGSGKLLRVEDWGMRKTAYPILKRTKAHFFNLVYAGTTDLVAKIERQIRISDEIVKFHSMKVADEVTAEELEAEVVFSNVAPPEPERRGGRRAPGGPRRNDRGNDRRPERRGNDERRSSEGSEGNAAEAPSAAAE